MATISPVNNNNNNNNGDIGQVPAPVPSSPVPDRPMTLSSRKLSDPNANKTRRLRPSSASSIKAGVAGDRAPSRPPSATSAKSPRVRPKTAPPPPASASLGGDYDWSREQLIGKGRCTNCHEVVKVPRTKDGKIVAVRKIGSPICRSIDVSDAFDEVKRLTNLPPHQNIMFIKACTETNFQLDVYRKPFVEMEYLREGSLNAKIQKHFELRGAFTQRQILRYMHQLASAVSFLHSHGVLHRDIRPKNMFIVDQDTLKLGDVGSPKVVQNRSHASRYPGAFWPAINRLNAGPMHCCLSPSGSWPYMPPEIMCEFKIPSTKDIHITSREVYVPASDVWSMGVVLFELLCLKVPFPGRTPKQVQKSIGNGMPLAQFIVPAVRDYPNHLRLLVRDLLCLEPNERMKLPILEKLLHEEIQKVDLFKAVKEGDLATVKRLVEGDHADVNMMDAAGYTPLMWASENGHAETVQFLVKHNANIHAKNRHGWTAMDWADNKDVIATLNRGNV